MRGARRTLGVAPVKKAAATCDKVLAIVAIGERDFAGKRDRALLLLGFALRPAVLDRYVLALDIACFLQALKQPIPHDIASYPDPIGTYSTPASP
jgi:hypothetical protein